MSGEKVAPICLEAEELAAIFVSSVRTVQNKSKIGNQKSKID